jgi:aminocarboxymuconate-semialdehyde decarboxylase
MIIDVFNHIYPRRFLDSFVKRRLPILMSFVQAVPSEEFNYFTDPSKRITVMDKYGIDIQAVSLPNSQIRMEGLSPNEAIKLTRSANDEIAEIAEKHQERLVGLATALRLEEEYVDELKRCVHDLGLKGIQIPSNNLGEPLDKFEEFFDAAASLDVPILLHPVNWDYYPWINEYDLTSTFGWPFDTSVALARLVFSGVIERNPNLKIIAHHMGAMIPYFEERIRGFYDEAVMHPAVYGAEHPEQFGAKLNRHPIEYFHMIYADTALYGSKAAMLCGYSFFGPDHVLFSTDYPFGPEYGERWVRDTVKATKELGIPEEDKKKIFETNARRLLKLK